MTQFTQTITTNNDTGEENLSTNAVSLSSSDLEMCKDGSTPQKCAIRATNVTIPQGSVITSAYFDFTVVSGGTSTGTVRITADDSDDSAALSTTASDISGRTDTTEYVDWAPGTFNSSVNKRTYNFYNVVQEIVDRGGWASGNAMTFLFGNAGDTFEINVRSSNSGGNEPYLVIEYESAAPTISDNLLAYYKLEDETDSAGSLDGTMTGGSYVSGHIDNAATLDGVNDKFETGVDPDGATAFSANFWVNIDNADLSNCMVMSHSNGSTESFLMRTNGTARWNCNFFTTTDNAGDVNSNDNTVTTGWHMITMTWKQGEKVQIYLDGRLMGNSASTISGVVKSLSDVINFGYRVRYGNYGDCIVDEAGFWDKQLTFYEIDALYNSGSGLQYPFGEGGAVFNALSFGVNF